MNYILWRINEFLHNNSYIIVDGRGVTRYYYFYHLKKTAQAKCDKLNERAGPGWYHVEDFE